MSTLRLSLAALDGQAGRRDGRWSQATTPSFRHGQEGEGVARQTSGQALVRGVGRDGDRGDARDVVHRIGESNGRRTKNGRERGGRCEWDTRSSSASKRRSRLDGAMVTDSKRLGPLRSKGVPLDGGLSG